MTDEANATNYSNLKPSLAYISFEPLCGSSKDKEKGFFPKPFLTLELDLLALRSLDHKYSTGRPYKHNHYLKNSIGSCCKRHETGQANLLQGLEPASRQMQSMLMKVMEFKGEEVNKHSLSTQWQGNTSHQIEIPGLRQPRRCKCSGLRNYKIQTEVP